MKRRHLYPKVRCVVCRERKPDDAYWDCEECRHRRKQYGRTGDCCSCGEPYEPRRDRGVCILCRRCERKAQRNGVCPQCGEVCGRPNNGPRGGPGPRRCPECRWEGPV